MQTRLKAKKEDRNGEYVSVPSTFELRIGKTEALKDMEFICHLKDTSQKSAQKDRSLSERIPGKNKLGMSSSLARAINREKDSEHRKDGLAKSHEKKKLTEDEMQIIENRAIAGLLRLCSSQWNKASNSKEESKKRKYVKKKKIDEERLEIALKECPEDLIVENEHNDVKREKLAENSKEPVVAQIGPKEKVLAEQKPASPVTVPSLSTSGSSVHRQPSPQVSSPSKNKLSSRLSTLMADPRLHPNRSNSELPKLRNSILFLSRYLLEVPPLPISPQFSLSPSQASLITPPWQATLEIMQKLSFLEQHNQDNGLSINPFFTATSKPCVAISKPCAAAEGIRPICPIPIRSTSYLSFSRMPRSCTHVAIAQHIQTCIKRECVSLQKPFWDKQKAEEQKAYTHKSTAASASGLIKNGDYNLEVEKITERKNNMVGRKVQGIAAIEELRVKLEEGK